MLFFLAFFSYAIGIACSTIADFQISLGYTLIFPLIGILFMRGKRWYIIILMITMSLGGWWMGHGAINSRERSWRDLEATTQGFSGKYQVTGQVEKLLYNSDLTDTYRLKIDSIDNISTHKKYQGDGDIGIFIEIPNNLHIAPGDTITYTGKIFPIIDMPLKGFARYAWYHRIYGKSSVTVFERKQKSIPGSLEKIQDWAQGLIFRGFPDTISGIILGMTIGNIEFLNSEVKKDFTNAGITHILVVSGSNIAFVIMIIVGVLKYFPIGNLWRMAGVSLFVIWYGFLVGWDIPVIRAVAMGIITYIALEGGKKVSSVALLFFVGWVLLIYSPLALIYDAGFGLSFAGTLGILTFQGELRKRLSHAYIPGFCTDILSVTIAASIGSIIATIYHFGTIPLFSLVSNILISGVLGWILLASVVYLGLSFLGIWFLYIWGWTIYIPTAYIVWVGRIFGNGYIYTLSESQSQILSFILIGMSIPILFLIESKKLLESEKL